MKLLSAGQAARIAECSADNLRYHCRKGRLLGIQVDRGNGRIETLFIEEDVRRFAEQWAKTHPRVRTRMPVPVSV
jgi:hypothetical protein